MSFHVGTVTPSGLFMPESYDGRAARASAGSGRGVRYAGGPTPSPGTPGEGWGEGLRIAECGFPVRSNEVQVQRDASRDAAVAVDGDLVGRARGDRECHLAGGRSAGGAVV